MPDNDPVSKPRVGFIGLGAMGGRMARRLVAGGYDLTVHYQGGRVSGAVEESAVVPTRRFRWTDGVLIGLVAAIVSTLILLLAGAVSGHGWHILSDAGMIGLPSRLHSATGVSAALSYLLCHTLLYVVAGVVALGLAGLADRLPPLVAALLLAIIIVEFGFMVLTTEGLAGGRIDQVTWRSILIGHLAGSLALALGIVRAHPSVRQALVRGYEW